LSQPQADRQRDEFLKKVLLEHETIEGIGKGRKATLEAYGIETAFDITEENVANVPGFGPTLERKLLSWRRLMEARFRFDPTQALTPTDLRTLHIRYHARRNSLQRTLQGGDEKLLEIKKRADKALQAIQDEARKLMPMLAQAEMDLKAL
jgi:DNA-binding helix-hairpin-helix protein with protein kinase domain